MKNSPLPPDTLQDNLETYRVRCHRLAVENADLKQTLAQSYARLEQLLAKVTELRVLARRARFISMYNFSYDIATGNWTVHNQLQILLAEGRAGSFDLAIEQAVRRFLVEINGRAEKA